MTSGPFFYWPRGNLSTFLNVLSANAYFFLSTPKMSFHKLIPSIVYVSLQIPIRKYSIIKRIYFVRFNGRFTSIKLLYYPIKSEGNHRALNSTKRTDIKKGKDYCQVPQHVACSLVKLIKNKKFLQCSKAPREKLKTYASAFSSGFVTSETCPFIVRRLMKVMLIYIYKSSYISESWIRKDRF